MFYTRTKGNNVDYLVMREIDNMKSKIASEGVNLEVLKTENQKASKTKQQYLSALKKVEQRQEQLNAELEKSLRMSTVDANTQRKEIAEFERKIEQNKKIIEELKEDKSKDKRVSQLEMKIEEVIKKIKMQ